jgi:hypothetical protein
VSALELLRAPARQTAALADTSHRPWPLNLAERQDVVVWPLEQIPSN